MEEPRVCHMQGAKRIFRYIKGTLTDGIFYANNSDVKLVGYTDSDWAGEWRQEKIHRDTHFIWTLVQYGLQRNNQLLHSQQLKENI